MFAINKELLNPLEKDIYNTLFDELQNNDSLSITDAANICGCSPSKISKFVNKLGFKNYKEYSGFIGGNVFFEVENETERLKNFLDDFNPEVIDRFVSYLKKFDKIILFGYGPSFIACEYFEYKLRSISDTPVWSVAHESAIDDLLTDGNLVVVFSTTGQFRSFDDLYENITSKNGKVAFVFEETCVKIAKKYDNALFLSKYVQKADLLPYEKSRVTFFFFIEEVIKKIPQLVSASDKFKIRR